jgi:hypothetical protein
MNPSNSTSIEQEARDVSVANVTAIVLIWYIIAVVVSRLMTEVISPGIGVILPPHYHFHHILYGLVLMAVGGFFGLYWGERRLAVLIGSWFLGLGLGLAVDEVGLILVTSDAGYFDPISYPIIVIVAQLILIAAMAARQQDRKFKLQ